MRIQPRIGSKVLTVNIIQIKSGSYSNFSYLIYCPYKKEAAVVDPPEKTSLITDIIDKESLILKYIINTHNHGDHICGNEKIKEITNAKIAMHSLDAQKYQKADIQLEDQDIISIGNSEIKIIHTPGHTIGGICLYADNFVITGDSLFVGDSGRTDLEGGDRKALGASLRKLFSMLPENTVVYPGHDYGSTPASTLKREKLENVNVEEYGFRS